jgi:hypothetical protein
VSKAWRRAADGDAVWEALRRRRLPLAGAAAGALRRRADAEAAPAPAKRVFRALLRTHACLRCKAAFRDGANAPDSCTYHSIFFSGGRLNGHGIRFTCCNRRAHHIPTGARDANGCRTAPHVGAESAWEVDGTGVKARVRPASARPPALAAAAGSGGAATAGGGGGGAWPVVTSQPGIEWHPDSRPGLLELPSNLVMR